MEDTLNNPLTDARLCIENGLTAGTLLQSELSDADEDPTLVGVAVLKITAVGEEEILARVVSLNGELVVTEETRWCLSGAEWLEVDVRFNPVPLLRS